MAPYELLGSAGWGEDAHTPGVAWLSMLREHFDRSVWLNPDPPSGYGFGTVKVVRDVFPMFQLTLEGLGEAVSELVKGKSTRR
jgi:uncharacterized protein with von Willebrand factor type A (vWA) domain